MAWIFTLVAGTSTLNINDGTNYQVLVNGFHAPPPQVLTSYAGPNLFRHGADLIERSYGNRTVTVGLEIKGTNASTLGAQVQNIWDYLRRAEEFSKDGQGTQVQLRYQWEGATGTYLFDIIEGRLDLGANLHSAYLLRGTRARSAQLVMEAKPFVTQPSETAMNYIKDPSFEVAGSVLADWTVDNTAGGTIVRTTGTAKYGTASVAMRSTGGAGSIALLQEYVGTEFPSGTTIRMSWYASTPAGSMLGTIRLTQRNSTGTSLQNETFQFTATTAWTRFTTSTTATGTVGTLDMYLIAGASQNATMQWDGIYLGKGSLPAAWVSGRDVANHFDDNGQAHINYLDIFDVPGDVPAPIQVKVLENEAHNKVWVGARHDTRMTGTGMILEGESFTATIGGAWSVNTTAAANESNGSSGQYAVVATLDGTGNSVRTYPSMTATAPSVPQVIMYNIAVPPQGMFRVLARMMNANGDAATGTGGGTANSFVGVGYQYGGRTVDPSATAEYTTMAGTPGTGSGMLMYDLGVLTIPPFRTPQAATLGTLGIRIAMYVSRMTANSPWIDYVELMPINEGGVYGSKTSAADNLWVDSVSSPSGIYRVTTADVAQSFPPAQVGAPPLAHPKGSRFYFQFDGTPTGSIGYGAIVSVSYTPRYLNVGT